MVSGGNIFLCAALALFSYSCVGWALTGRILPRSLGLMLAPALGWAVHSAVALPLLFAIGMTRAAVFILFALAVVASIWAIYARKPATEDEPLLSRATSAALIAAALLALAVAAGTFPKTVPDGVTLSAPVFDHAKVAMIDEMVRSGVPPANPFFAGGTAPRLSYYYLWHFSAAELALIAGATGWEADAALTWFTAFASLTAMMGLAAGLGGRASSAVWVVILAATASARPILHALFGVRAVEQFAGERSGFGGWLFQTIWAPQHTASALCCVLSVFLLVQWAQRRSTLTLAMCTLTMVACFESSTWIGGIVLPLALIPVAVAVLVQAEPKERRRMVLELAASVLVALLLISPFFYDQLQATALRAAGSPIAIAPYQVVSGAGVTGRIFNLPAYWLVFLPVEFPAFYLAGLWSLFNLLKDRTLAPERKLALRSFALLLFVSLGAAWLLVSTLGENNDLGWRAVLPAVHLLIVFAAVGLSRLAFRPLSLALVAAIFLIATGVPDSVALLARNIVGAPKASSQLFAASPALWQAVRAHSSEAERIANNPLFVKDLTPWPVNISWALLSNRRSCYAALDLAEPFVALPRAKIDSINAQFIRVFAGEGTLEDVRQMANDYHCDVALVTPQDGAWSRDPFAASPNAKLVESNAAWRIYRLAKTGQ